MPTYGDPCRNPNFSGPRINGVAFEPTECGDSWGELTLAITTFWSVGDTRVQAGIAFNSNLSWNVYPGPQVGNSKEFRRVALHELGHALGLDHEEELDSIMAPFSSTLENLTADDIAGVNSIYGTSAPDSFQFNDYLDVPTGSLLESNAIIVTGIGMPAAITVSGDLSSEYSINSTAFTNIHCLPSPRDQSI